MNKLAGRIALVTGASSGIGAAICVSLVKAGLKVVGVTIEEGKVEKMANDLKDENGSLQAIYCNLTKDEEVYALFNSVKDLYGGVDICVNSAGMSFAKSLLDGTPEEWRYAMDLNVIALCLCTKLAIASMRERSVDDGHVINISSLAAHGVSSVPYLHFYSATKHAVKAVTTGIRQELCEANSHIRISSISPAIVRTNFACNMYGSHEIAENVYSVPVLRIEPEDIASTVLHILESPNHVEIHDVLVNATGFQPPILKKRK